MGSMKKRKSILAYSILLTFLLVFFINCNSSLTHSRVGRIDFSSRPRIVGKKEMENNVVAPFSLSIPKISLYVPLYDVDDPKNNVNYNVEINKKSDMPNVIGGNLILEAHSGTGYHSYFKYLYKLEKGDLVNIIYHDSIYTYQISDYYEIIKVGKARIHRDFDKSTITLITCVGDKKQGIHIGYLVKKESLYS